MRLLILFFVALFAGAPSFAAEKRAYAVLSIIGDRMLLAHHAAGDEARPPRNVREFLPVEGGVIDDMVLLAVNDALVRADPKAKPRLLKPRDAALFVAQEPLLENGGDTRPLLGALQNLARGSGATHLVLVSKFRNEARLRLTERMVGTGPLEGVGFYVDTGYETRNLETGEAGSGALWPFAYVRIELIDLAKGEILREARVMASTPFSSAALRGEHIWHSLTPQQKVRALQDLVRTECERVIPTLLD